MGPFGRQIDYLRPVATPSLSGQHLGWPPPLRPGSEVCQKRLIHLWRRGTLGTYVSKRRWGRPTRVGDVRLNAVGDFRDFPAAL